MEEEDEEEEKGLRQQLEQTQHALKRTERQLEKMQSYNEELRLQIENLSAELHGYRSASQHRVDVECQVDEKDIVEAYGDKPFPDWSTENSGETTQVAENSVSIADSLKAAAEEVVWNEAGFVYDNTSGLYYDYNSGYYYDATRCLYYDPSTTAYYFYDEKEKTYKFHSYASGQYSEETSQTWPQQSHTVDSVQDAAADSQGAPNENSNAKGKSHKQKLKEKAKLQKHKVSKAKRRTKSSKHRLKTKMRKRECEDHKEGSTSIIVDSSDDADKKQIEDKVDENHSAEVMEDESSDSLATDESEMESELESGELTDRSSNEEEEEAEEKEVELCGAPVEYDLTAQTESEPEMSASYPPCVRVIVQESDTVEVGTFFMVTCTGGTIGRDKDPRHAIQIPDINISKVHADIKYDNDSNCYTVEDLGSQNGTYLNNLRISEVRAVENLAGLETPKQKSQAVPLTHGDTLQIASTQMLLHIHPGRDTCDECEPGQVQAALRAQNAVVKEHVILSKEERKKQIRDGMRSIKKKYGLANSAYVDNVAAIKNPDYADMADIRRRFIGSEHSSHKERHQVPASVHRPISAENKGHRMLAKMGWTEGSGLGKDSTGRAEPVTVELRANQTAGLGSASSLGVSLDNVQSAHRTRRLLQTQARYQQLDSTTPAEGGDSASLSATTDNGQHSGRSGASSSCTSSSAKFQLQWIRGETQKPP